MQAARVLPPVTITVPRKRRPSLGPLTSQKLLQEPSLLDDGAASVLAERVRHFVPRCVLRRVVDCGPIDAAEIVRLQGAVGFFDISGFTKLGSDLAHAQNETRRGSFKGEGRVATALSASHAEGAELLTTQLNGMFTGVLGVIRKHGGDVIKFVGDAMIRAGAARGEELDALGARAVACALECVETMRNTNEKLGIHIGLAMGDVMSVVCGGFEGRYEAFICGPACDACYQAADDAKKGEVIAPRAMWERLRLDGGEADDRETSAALVRIVAFPELELAAPEADPAPTRALAEAASPFLPDPVVATLDPRRGGARSSVRRLALIFMAVGGLQHAAALDGDGEKPDAATNERRDVAFLKAIQRALLGVQAAAAAHGAILRQFVRDDKDFRKRVPVVSRATRVGVTVGNCFCGPVGATPEDQGGVKGSPGGRQEFAIVGDAVNLAARLMAKASPGEDAPVENYALEPGDGPSSRRGSRGSRPSISEARGLEPSEEPALAFVDRGGAAAAAARLCDAGEVVDALVVAGGAGQGKTALLEDVANRLREAGGLALYGSCREDDRLRPLSSVRGLVAGAVRFLLYRERTPESATRSLVPPRTDYDADRELATTFSSVDKLLPHEGDAPLCSSPLSPEQRNRRRRSYGDEPPDLDREAPTFESRASLAETSRDGGRRRALIDEAVELVERTQRPRRRAPSRRMHGEGAVGILGAEEDKRASRRERRRSWKLEEQPWIDDAAPLEPRLQLATLVELGHVRARDAVRLFDILEVDEEGADNDGDPARRGAAAAGSRSRAAGAARVVLAHRPLATKRTRAFDALLRALNADGGGRLAASPRTGRSKSTRPSPSKRPKSGVTKLLRGGQYRVHPGGDDGEAPIATVEVALGPLSFVEMRQLVGVAAAEGWRAFVDVQFALVEFLLERSSGNPFVALELLHELLERRVAAVDGATGELRLSGDASGAVGVPSAVAAAVSGAFDTLDSACQAALRLAAALGHRADVACLAYLFDYFFPEDADVREREQRSALTFEASRSSFGDVSRELLRLKYVVADGNDVVFVSDLARSVLYHQMVTADRRKVHRQIVCWQTFRLVKNESSPATSRSSRSTFASSRSATPSRDGRVDVALGFCDDCALISENHALPAALCAFAQIGLMRAAARVAAGTTAAHWTPWTRSSRRRTTRRRPAPGRASRRRRRPCGAGGATAIWPGRAACRAAVGGAAAGPRDAALEAFTAEASRGRA
ncbi:adenylate cyclase [Aureococcus anophagefferens]|nr:adenylate cyclase [Aureococcus anophagefferens]